MTDMPYSIIGGGLMGAALAYHLASAGKKVLLIDDERVGRASGWNPGGVNPLHGPGFPDITQDFYMDAFNQHQMHHRKIKDLSGIDFHHKVIERIFLAKNKGELNALEKSLGFYNQLQDFSASIMDMKELLKFDDRISHNFEGALFTKGNIRLDSERFRLALLSSSRKLGAEILTGTLQEVFTWNEIVKAILVNGRKISVSGLCMARGAWENHPVDGWYPGYDLSIKPVLGDLLLVQSLGDPLKADISHGIKAVYQHDAHHYWIGGTTRESGILGPCTLSTKQELLRGVRDFLPGWKSFRVIRHSSAARPVAENELPVMGRAPSYANGWVMNGGGSKGVLLCLTMGRILTDLMMNKDVPTHIEKFFPRTLLRA
jgi:glycine/D-amino acid oxidase-like deaminating enzyme